MSASFRDTWSRVSTDENEYQSQFPHDPSSRHHDSRSLLTIAWSSFSSLSIRRKTILISAFTLGVFLAAMLKYESIVWFFAATAGSNPMVGWGQGAPFEYPGLRFDLQDRKLQITVFSDLHLGDKYRPGSDNKTISVMRHVLDAETGTDLVVLNGDLTSCEYIGPEAVNGYIDMIIDPLLERKMPFTAAFGNHDMSKTCDTRAVAQHMRDKANVKGGRKVTWTENAVYNGDYHEVGTSNYYIPVYSAGGGGNPTLKMMLWFFDSKGGNRYQPQGNDVAVADWVDDKVVSWFKFTRDQINKDNGAVIPSLAFVHIPPSVTEAFRKSDLRTESTEPGISEEIISVLADSVPGGDSAFLQALVETEGLMAVFSGHDHRIDWCMKYSSTRPIPNFEPATASNGMHLCFGRHTGYGGYSDYQRGGRQIVIDEDVLNLPPHERELQTWIRLEDGRVSGNVSLNATYGTDKYEKVERKKTFLDQEKESEGVSGSATTETDASSMSSTSPKRSTTDAGGWTVGGVTVTVG